MYIYACMYVCMHNMSNFLIADFVLISSIQAHAIAGFSQCVGSSNGQVANLIKDMMTPCVAGRGPVTRLIPTPAVDRGHAVVTGELFFI